MSMEAIRIRTEDCEKDWEKKREREWKKKKMRKMRKKKHEIWKTKREIKTLFSKGHKRFEWEIFMAYACTPAVVFQFNVYIPTQCGFVCSVGVKFQREQKERWTKKEKNKNKKPFVFPFSSLIPNFFFFCFFYSPLAPLFIQFEARVQCNK